MMKLYTKSRDGMLYEATATYEDGKVTVHKGSKINRRNADGFKPKGVVVNLRNNDALFDDASLLKQDVIFSSLSTAATFVTGRIANGKIVWKTENGKYVKRSLQQSN